MNKEVGPWFVGISLLVALIGAAGWLSWVRTAYADSRFNGPLCT